MRAALICLLLCAATALADDAKPSFDVIEAGKESIVVVTPAYRTPAELSRVIHMLAKKVVIDGQRLVCNVDKERVAALRTLIERSDRRIAEVLVLTRVEEVLEPIARLGKTSVIERRLLRMRASVGQESELLLEQRAGGKSREAEDRQKLTITPLKVDARGARLQVSFELDLPGAAGPGAEEDGGGRSRLRRTGSVQVQLPANRAMTVVEVELGQERGGRRVFRVWMRALVGEAASAAPNWERRIEVSRIVLDTPAYAVLQLDGIEYQVRKGARLGALLVVDIAEDVTFRVGKQQFSLSAK